MKAYYDKRPAAIEAVGNGNCYYRQDIKETTSGDETGERSQWECDEYVVSGEADYDKCVAAVIRAKYGIDAELALMNKYNSYKQGIIDDVSIEEEYASYLTFVKDVKAKVKEALAMKDGTETGTGAEEAAAKTGQEAAAYEQGMALEEGKYYTQYGVVYECVKGTPGQKKDLYQMTAYAKAVEE